MNVIESHELSKTFSHKKAVDHFNMLVQQGDIYGFVGHNGAGKTTVMRMIAGLAEPSGGEVRVFNSSPQKAIASRKIGVLIESPGLYGRLNAFDNMMLKALALGLVRPKERVRELLVLVGLENVKSKKTKFFSMGMKQRLGLALALLGSPDLLLLDEPLNGLDPEGAREIRELIVKLNGERGITVVVSSHVLEQLGKMATQYGVIREGRMVRQLSATEVEQECKDFLEVQTTNPTLALAVLQEHFPTLHARSLPNNSLHLFGTVTPEDVGTLLNEKGIVISGLYTHKRDLEEFFVELMGAEYHE